MLSTCGNVAGAARLVPGVGTDEAGVVSLTCGYVAGAARLVPGVGAEEAGVVPLLDHQEGDARPVVSLQVHAGLPAHCITINHVGMALTQNLWHKQEE